MDQGTQPEQDPMIDTEDEQAPEDDVVTIKDYHKTTQVSNKNNYSKKICFNIIEKELKPYRKSRRERMEERRYRVPVYFLVSLSDKDIRFTLEALKDIPIGGKYPIQMIALRDLEPFQRLLPDAKDRAGSCYLTTNSVENMMD